MAAHLFNKSIGFEKQTTQFHDLNYQQIMLKKEFTLEKIDRTACDYKTQQGMIYQQNDTDTLLLFKRGEKCSNVLVSEKTRKAYYGDIYLEIISVLAHTPHKEKTFEFKKEGWGVKTDNIHSPHSLSVVCINEKQQNITSIFIADYKNLKKQLFHDSRLMTVINHPSFIDILIFNINNRIKIKGKAGNFRLELSKPENQTAFFKRLQNTFGVKDVVFAYNYDKMGNYYTIGFTYSEEYISSLCRLSKKTSPIPALKNTGMAKSSR